MTGATQRRPAGIGRNAFTLVELLVVLAVVAIISAVAAPSVSQWITNYRTKTVARQLMTDLQFARMTAVAQKTPCQVVIDPVNNKYTITMTVAGTTVGIPRQLGVSTIGNNQTNPYYAPGVSLATTPAVAGTLTVQFNSLGNVTFTPANATTATVTQGTYAYNVAISPTGNMQITNGGTQIVL